MKRFVAALGVCAMLCASAAVAEPALVTDQHLAWIGENSYLYIEDAAGAIKRLPATIVDLLSIRGNSIYCLAEDGSLYDIHLDGTAGAILSNAPSEAQLNAARSTDRWKLENNVLTVSDATAAKQSRELSRSVVTAGEGADVLYYVERTYTGAYLLQSEALPVELSPLELGPVATLHDIAVSQPISITASNTAVTIVDADRSVEVVSLADRSVTRLPAISTKTAAAAYCNGQVISYLKGEDGSYQVENIADVTLNTTSPFGLTAAAVPTVTPTVKPTATPAPTATPKKTTYYNPYANSGTSSSGSSSGSSGSVQRDNGVYKGMKGSSVRAMQQRLQQLGYPVGNVDGTFGEQTLLAVHLFQNALHVKERDGLTEKQLNTLYSLAAPVYDVFLPLRKGDSGTSVLLMQRALAQLGFNPGKLDGIYGKNTVTAVAAFQQAIGLPLQYGEILGEQASHALLELLYAQIPGTVYPAPATPVTPVTPGQSGTPTFYPPTTITTPTNIVISTPTDVMPVIPSVPTVPDPSLSLPETIGGGINVSSSGSALPSPTIPAVTADLTPPPGSADALLPPSIPAATPEAQTGGADGESVLDNLGVTVPPLPSLPTLPPEGEANP